MHKYQEIFIAYKCVTRCIMFA